MNINLHGGLPPIPTPFDHGEVAHDKLAANVRRLCSTGVRGRLVLGSNGEHVYLSEGEKRQVVKGGLRGILRRAELLPSDPGQASNSGGKRTSRLSWTFFALSSCYHTGVGGKARC